MVTLELRYIPGLAPLLPVPLKQHCFSVMSQPWKTQGTSFSNDGARFTFDTQREALNHCRTLVQLLKPRGISLVLPEIFPFSAICIDEQGISKEMWRLAPAGHLLLPINTDIPGTSPWLYDWCILQVAGDKSIMERLSPINSMLINGPFATECFFCGSRHHESASCAYMWRHKEPAVSLSSLCDINPSLWVEYLKKAGTGKFNFTASLDMLMQDLRSIFTWHFASRICRSTAAHFKEFKTSPLKSLDVFEHRQIIEGAIRGNIDDIRHALRENSNRQDRTTPAIFKGFLHMATGNSEKAEESWWDAERESSTPILKSYAAILQARLFLLRGDKLKAEASIRRAHETDPSAISAYQSMLISAAKGDKTNVLRELHKLSTIPHLLTASLCDPFLIRYCLDIENYFQEIWKHQETVLDKQFSQLERTIREADKTFESEKIRDAAIKLRDWQGRRASMGIRPLMQSSSFINDLQKKVNKEVNLLLRKTLLKFQRYENNCRNILRRVPKRSSTREIVKGCSDVIKMVQASTLTGSSKRVVNMSDVQQEIIKINNKYKRVEALYSQYKERMWQRRLVLKFMMYGTALAVITWVSVYIYDLINKIE